MVSRSLLAMSRTAGRRNGNRRQKSSAGSRQFGHAPRLLPRGLASALPIRALDRARFAALPAADVSRVTRERVALVGAAISARSHHDLLPRISRRLADVALDLDVLRPLAHLRDLIRDLHPHEMIDIRTERLVDAQR